MSRLTVAEHMRILRQALGRARRHSAARSIRSPLLSWRLAPSRPDEFVFVPQDLRTTDPSFLDEISAGQLGLAGAVAHVGGQSPFAVEAPTTDWARELHSFAWLSHLRAAEDEYAVVIAHRLVEDWIDRYRAQSGIAWEPAVVARRATAWINNSGFLLDPADVEFYRKFMRSLGQQIRGLDALRRGVPTGPTRLRCLMALVLAGLSLSRHERHLVRMTRPFLREIAAQILPDGGHVSRNPAVVLDLLFDLLPLRQCYLARDIEPPREMLEAIQRMITFLRAMRLGDGALARFNGMGRTEPDAVATILALDATPGMALPDLVQSRYVRLERRDTVVVMDCGPVPPLELSGEAHAGCLSFEMSCGACRIAGNGGATDLAHGSDRPASRATASHSTLCLDSHSSSRLVPSVSIERIAGGAGLSGPADVQSRHFEDADGAWIVEAAHDGYMSLYGIIHSRRLALSPDGLRLEVVDRLAPPSGILRTRKDLPFAIHVHVHDAIACRMARDGSHVMIDYPGRISWRLSVTGARASIEASVDFTGRSGPAKSRQIVLRGTSPGESTITWCLEAVDPGVSG